MKYNTEHKRISLKAIQQNFSLSFHLRLLASIQLSLLPHNKHRNRCVLTGRSRGVYNYFKISRIMIRSLAAKGLLAGVKKHS